MEQNRVSTPQAPQTAPAAHTSRSKAPAAQTSAEDAAGAGGFLSLLSALGDSLQGPLDSPDDGLLGSGSAPDLGAADAAPSPGTDTAILMAWLGGNMPPTDAAQGASTLALAQGGALAGSAAQPALGQGSALTGSGLQPAVAALATEFLPVGGLVAQTARLDNAADAAALEGRHPVAGSRRAFSRLPGGMLSSVAGAASGALAPGPRLAAADKASAAPAWTTAAPLQAAPERRDGGLAAAVVQRSAPEGALPSALAAQAAPLPPAEAALLARGSGERMGPEGVPGVWSSGHAGPEATPGADAAPAVLEPGQTPAEEALAEQVAYWVSENLQNAELTVTHDGQPVEVSVSMSGKEAHIVFGSDQSETRELLDASMAQLRDLLHSEGLILSGVTVGGSGARNADTDGGADTPRGRQGGRQAQMPAPVGEIGAPRARILTENAVDVFV